MKNMKKLWSVLLLVVLLAAMAPRARAENVGAFAVSERTVFTDMDRSWLQGYEPAVAWGWVSLVMPVCSEKAVGNIQAELLVENEAVSPFRPQSMGARTQRVQDGLWAVRFRLQLLAGYRNGDYPCLVRVTGGDAEGNALSADIPTVIHIRDGRQNTEAMLIAVANDETVLKVGEAGELSVRLSNPCLSVGFEELTLTVSDPAGDVLPAGMDTVTLPRLMPGEGVDLAFPVTVLPGAKVAPHSLRFDFRGRALDREVTLSVSCTVPVVQELRLEQGGLRMPESVVAGDSVTASLPLMNMGKGDIVNAMVTISLPGITERQSVLVGTIQPGETKQAQITLTAPKDALGESSGTVTISGEDNDGNSVSYELPVRLMVEEAVRTAALDTQGTAGQKAPAAVIALSVACAVLAAALIAQSILLRNKIHRLEEDRL